MRSHCAGLLRGALAALALASACGCTTHSYAGIDLRPGRASVDLQALAERARAGDKQAQLELGVRYEKGAGVPQDREQAISLYRSAARDEGGPLQVYSPPASSSGMGQVITIDQGPRMLGLPKAKGRLAALGIAPFSGNSDLMQDSGQWHEFPWDPDEVFKAILANAESDGLDPESIATKIGAQGKGNASLIVTTRYKSTPYSCADNPAHIPVAHLSRVCEEATLIREHVYTSGEPRRTENYQGQTVGQGVYTGDFIRSAPERNLQIVDLNKDRGFNESRLVGHLSFPLSATLVISPNKSRLVLIYAATGDAVVGDKIMSIAIYSIG